MKNSIIKLIDFRVHFCIIENFLNKETRLHYKIIEFRINKIIILAF